MPDCIRTGTPAHHVLPHRHAHTCEAPTCRGCEPCPERHCRVCREEHVTVDGRGDDRTCGPCIASTREHIAEIVRLVDGLPAEAAVKGADSEAMALLAPAADPDQWDARATSALAGKTVLADCDARDADQLRAWLDRARAANLHPMFVLGTWELMWRDHLDQPRPAIDTIAAAASYLEHRLHAMAHFEHLDFEGMVRDLRACRGNLERVLRDGEQHDRGAPCSRCGALMERVWGATLDDDAWRCTRDRCTNVVSDRSYQGEVDRDHLANATALTAADMERRFGVAASATKVRVWGSRGLVRKAGVDHLGLLLYTVADVEARLAPPADDPDAA